MAMPEGTHDPRGIHPLHDVQAPGIMLRMTRTRADGAPGAIWLVANMPEVRTQWAPAAAETDP